MTATTAKTSQGDKKRPGDVSPGEGPAGREPATPKARPVAKTKPAPKRAPAKRARPAATAAPKAPAAKTGSSP